MKPPTAKTTPTRRTEVRVPLTDAPVERGLQSALSRWSSIQSTLRFYLFIGAFSASSFTPASGSEDSLEDYQPLLDDSPFLSLAFKDRLARAGASGANKISFVGYARIDKEWQLCLIPPGTSVAVWTTVGGEVTGFEVTAFDGKKQTVELKKNGVSATLKLSKPD